MKTYSFGAGSSSSSPPPADKVKTITRWSWSIPDGLPGKKIDIQPLNLPAEIKAEMDKFRAEDEAAEAAEKARIESQFNRAELDAELDAERQANIESNWTRQWEDRADHQKSAASERRLKVGDRVLFRGRYSNQFSLAGEIECIHGSLGVGVRLVNGNFHWSDRDQVMHRDPEDHVTYY